MMRGCGRLLFLSCLFLLPFNVVIGKGVFVPDVFWLDRFGRISWEDEKARLDNFAIQLNNQPEMIGYVYVQVASRFLARGKPYHMRLASQEI